MMTTTPIFEYWVTCPNPNPRARMRLFCFPYAGGGAIIFREWSEGLPMDVDVCPVQLRGRTSRISEPPFTRLSPLIQEIARALIPHLDKPFAFFGHSMGATIAFELARKLRRERAPQPICLFASAQAAPQIPDLNPSTYDLPEAQFLEELRRLNGTPKEAIENPELMQLMLPTLRADFEIIQTYEYVNEPPIDCPITTFGGLHDEEISLEDLEGWQEQTTGSFVSRMLPGNHFFIHTAQKVLLRALSQELNQLVRMITKKQCL